MVGAAGCPSEHTLLDVVAERRLADVAEHLDACEACRELVAELARDAAPELPSTIRRFEIERLLGAGAMGLVYLARDPRLDRKVALKVLHARTAGKLVDEARAMARLEHDNLVTVYEIDEVGDEVAIAMEYLPGGTLRSWLATSRSWREIATAMRDVARGLAAIHAAGLVHRDLKPENILLDGAGRARVADLGLVTLQGAGAAGAGTPAYMAPEQHAGGPADERTDQYSFFVCWFEALAGRRPNGGPTIDALAGRRPNGSPTTDALAETTPPGPRAVQRLVARGLERDPARRHGSMADVAAAIDRLLRRGRARWLAAAAAALAIPTAGFVLSRSPSADPCARSADAALTVWNPSAAARLAAVYDTAGMTATGIVVARGLDEVSQSWAAMQRDSCAATHVRNEQSPAMLDRRTQCLRERLAAMESVLARLATADRTTLARGGEAVAALPAIADCDPTRLGARPLPTDPRALSARLELARARTLRSLGEGRKTGELVEPLIALGLELHDTALVAEARFVAAEALVDDRQLDRAAARFAETELAAEAAGDDDMRARALIAHATLVGALQQKPEAGTALLTRARAVMQRLGGRTDLANRALVADAALAASRGDLATGERLLGEALKTLPTTGPERWLRIVALRDRANMLYEQGRPADAESHARAAVTLAESTLGPDHIDVAETLSILALIANHLHHVDEARTHATRALAIKARVHGPDHVSLSSTLMVQALIARDSKTATGHAEARRATDRAIALRRAAFGPDNPMVLGLVAERGALAVDAGEHAIARASFAVAIPGLERAWGATHLGVVEARFSEALLDERSGDPASCALKLAKLADARDDIDLHRAHCFLLAGDHARATDLANAIGHRDLAAEDRATLDVLNARIAVARGARDRAKQLALAFDHAHPAPDPEVALDLALVWAQLGDGARASAITNRVLATAGVDLPSSDAYARASEIARIAGRTDDAARYATHALEVATAAAAGPDMLARYRCLASRERCVK